VVLFSYRTKCESPAGDQFWKFCRQCSIFGRIGDQWVAISSPEAASTEQTIQLIFHYIQLTTKKHGFHASCLLGENLFFKVTDSWTRDAAKSDYRQIQWLNDSLLPTEILLGVILKERGQEIKDTLKLSTTVQFFFFFSASSLLDHTQNQNCQPLNCHWFYQWAWRQLSQKIISWHKIYNACTM